MTIWLPLVVLAASVLAFPGTARSASVLSTQVVAGEFDPVQVLGCSAKTSDTQYNVDYYLGLACAIENHDVRTATIVRLRFTVMDAFGLKIGEYTQDAEGTYSPNVIVDLRGNRMVEGSPYFSVINIYPGAKTIAVALARVAFSDGSSFDANDLSTVNFDLLNDYKKADFKAQMCKHYSVISDEIDAVAVCTEAASRIDTIVGPISDGETKDKLLGYEAPVLEMAGYANCNGGDKSAGRKQLERSLSLAQQVLASTRDPELIGRLSRFPAIISPLVQRCLPSVSGSASTT